MGASSLHKHTWLVDSLDRWQISKTGWRTQFQHLALNGNFVTQKGSFGTLWRQRGSPPPGYHHQLFCLVCSDFHVWNIVLVNDVLQYSVLLIFLVGVSARTSSRMFPNVSKSLVPSSNRKIIWQLIQEKSSISFLSWISFSLDLGCIIAPIEANILLPIGPPHRFLVQQMDSKLVLQEEAEEEVVEKHLK